MNAIRPSAARLTLIADLPGGGRAEFMPGQITIDNGPKSSVIVDRGEWPHIMGASQLFDAILGGQPLPAIPAAPCAAPSEYDDMPFGTQLLDGFFTGFHPVHRNAVLITAPQSMEGRGSWQQAGEHCSNQGDGRKRPDRLESLVQFQRLATCNAAVDAFKEGGSEAFADASYWTDEEYKFGSGCAWSQGFGSGHSGRCGKGNALRVRPVRILFI